MRDALNKNPKVQRAVIGVAALGLVLLFVVRMMGGGDSASPADSAIPPALTGAAPGVSVPTVPGTDPGIGSNAANVVPEGVPTGVPEPPLSATSAPAPEAGGLLVAGKGLPASLALDYGKGRAIVLLIVKKKGIDDRLVERAVKRLRSRGDVAVFVVPVKDIARYSQITQGVNVNRTPALVVIHPRSSATAVPTATVNYGFRNPASVDQAVDDALYNGPTVPYHPG